MNAKAEVKWVENMAFNAEVNGHSFNIDADEMVGGENKGPRPKPLILVALAGCTGMDVISILKKMRINPKDFKVNVDAVSTSDHPKHYNKFHITYTFKGDDLPIDKLEKAVNLSQDRYCGVSFMLGKVAEITHEIKIV